MTSSAAQKVGLMAGTMAFLAVEQRRRQQGVFAMTNPSDMEDLPSEPRRAICILDSQPNQTGRGVVKFEQENSYARTLITGTFSGLKPG